MYSLLVSAINPTRFEKDIADLYRELGSHVRHDVSLAGSQIDVIVTERTESGSWITRIVECKAYGSPVGVHAIRIFALTSQLLRERHLADVATIVSEHGFTRPARDAAAEFGIELLEVADLRARVADRHQNVVGPHNFPPVTPMPPTEADSHPEPKAFVAMPFTPQFDDVFLFGILPAAEEVGVTAQRADEILESVEIIQTIRDRIQTSQMVIADTTEINANVFYELGFADGLAKPILLIAQESTVLPFDLSGRKHLLYKSINQLRASLPAWLRSAMNT